MIKLLVVLFSLILLGCDIDSTGRQETMPKNDMQRFCVGRHSIEIPVSFSISPIVTGILELPEAGPQDPSLDIVIQFDGMTKERFKNIVQERRLKLQDSESDTVDVLRYDKEISDEMILFRVQEIEDAYFSELYFLRGPAMIKLRLESFRNGFIQAEEKLLRLSSAIKEWKSLGRNERQGFCLGPVILSAELSQESANFGFRDNSGLSLEVNIDTYARDDALPLLARMSRDRSVLRDLKIRTEVLRARERSIAGMSADEWLGIGYLGRGEDERTFKFMLETKRKSPGKTAPQISLSLDSAQPLNDGTPTTTKLGNEDALEMWDQIVDSIALAREPKS
ncbi:hypothetical protein IM543_19475 [Massilia sp. UMI-21]|nr:hypothetical protein IM543_19475 [Massilia sp. UMI-21]